MGENTYNHIFGGNDSILDVTQRSHLAQQQQAPGHTHSHSLDPADLHSLFRKSDKAGDILRSHIKSNLDSPGQHRTPPPPSPSITTCGLHPPMQLYSIWSFYKLAGKDPPLHLSACSSSCHAKYSKLAFWSHRLHPHTTGEKYEGCVLTK